MKNFHHLQKTIRSSTICLGNKLRKFNRNQRTPDNDSEMQRLSSERKENSYASSPFIRAAWFGDDHIVSGILSAGSIDRTEIDMALRASAGNGHTEVVGQLLKAGANVNCEPTIGEDRTALQAAARGGHLEMVEQLLKEGANVNAPAAAGGQTALQTAAGGGHLEVVERLLKEGADANAPAASWGGMTALVAAMQRGHHKVAQRIRNAGGL